MAQLKHCLLAYYKTRNAGTRNTGRTVENPGTVAEQQNTSEHQRDTLEQQRNTGGTPGNNRAIQNEEQL